MGERTQDTRFQRPWAATQCSAFSAGTTQQIAAVSSPPSARRSAVEVAQEESRGGMGAPPKLRELGVPPNPGPFARRALQRRYSRTASPPGRRESCMRAMRDNGAYVVALSPGLSARDAAQGAAGMSTRNAQYLQGSHGRVVACIGRALFAWDVARAFAVYSAAATGGFEFAAVLAGILDQPPVCPHGQGSDSHSVA